MKKGGITTNACLIKIHLSIKCNYYIDAFYSYFHY